MSLAPSLMMLWKQPPAAPGELQRRRILSICERIPVRVQMVPGVGDLLQGRVSFSSRR